MIWNSVKHITFAEIAAWIFGSEREFVGTVK